MIDCGAADPDLARSWLALRDAAREADADAVRQNYDEAFVGVGCAPVLLYASHYLSGTLFDQPLVALRGELAQLGLERVDTSFETEDHIAALLDVMRHLIVDESRSAPAALASQRAFFSRHIAPCCAPLCDAIAESAEAGAFYRAVAAFARAYFALESESFPYEPELQAEESLS